MTCGDFLQYLCYTPPCIAILLFCAQRSADHCNNEIARQRRPRRPARPPRPDGYRADVYGQRLRAIRPRLYCIVRSTWASWRVGLLNVHHGKELQLLLLQADRKAMHAGCLPDPSAVAASAAGAAGYSRATPAPVFVGV